MKFNDDNLEKYSQGTGHYGFSAVKIEDLGASEYTLVTIILDISGSTSWFSADMEACIKQIVQACRLSPRADYILLRLVVFANNMEEVHGFLPLEQCDPDKYDGCYNRNQYPGIGASTALFVSTENGILSSNVYAEQLAGQDYDVNSAIFIITDGDDNASGSVGAKNVKEALQKCIADEHMESIISVLVGVNVQTASLAKYLEDFKKDANLTQYVAIDNADAKTLAKLGEFVSQSISSQSQALGTGGPSQSLAF